MSGEGTAKNAPKAGHLPIGFSIGDCPAFSTIFEMTMPGAAWPAPGGAGRPCPLEHGRGSESIAARADAAAADGRTQGAPSRTAPSRGRARRGARSGGIAPWVATSPPGETPERGARGRGPHSPNSPAPHLDNRLLSLDRRPSPPGAHATRRCAVNPSTIRARLWEILSANPAGDPDPPLRWCRDVAVPRSRPMMALPSATGEGRCTGPM